MRDVRTRWHLPEYNKRIWKKHLLKEHDANTTQTFDAFTGTCHGSEVTTESPWNSGDTEKSSPCVNWNSPMIRRTLCCEYTEISIHAERKMNKAEFYGMRNPKQSKLKASDRKETNGIHTTTTTTTTTSTTTNEYTRNSPTPKHRNKEELPAEEKLLLSIFLAIEYWANIASSGARRLEGVRGSTWKRKLPFVHDKYNDIN